MIERIKQKYHHKYFHVIEDDQLHREVMAEIIKEAGYSVRNFESGEQYLHYRKALDFKHPIAIISDVVMSGIQGYDLVLNIKQEKPLQQVVIMTGYADSHCIEKVASKLCYILTKPYKHEDLKRLLSALTDCHHTYKAENKHNYPTHCEFGLDKTCPLHTSAA